MRITALLLMFVALLNCGGGGGSFATNGGTVVGADSPDDQLDEMQLDEATLE